MDDQKVNRSKIQIAEQMPEEAVNLSLEYMRNKGLASVLFMNSECVSVCKENDKARELVASLQLVLPGDKTVEESTFSQNGLYVKEPGSKGYMESYIEYLFYRLSKENRVVFAVTKTEHTLERYKRYMSQFEGIQAEGMVLKDYDHAVNEINAVIPDVLLLVVPLEEQFVFLQDYASMMNTKLIIGIDNFHQYLKKVVDSVPLLIKALHLENVYHWIKKDPKLPENK